MSIRRIESAYAYYLNSEMTGTQMAVLQALSYCANGNEKEKCYPSQAWLAKLTHLSVMTVDRACKSLRAIGAISWKSGGQIDGMNVANIYSFTFPHTPMLKKSERYEALQEDKQTTADIGAPIVEKAPPSSDGGYPHSEGTPSVRGGVPSQ